MEDTKENNNEETDSVIPAEETPTEEQGDSQPDGENDRTAEQFAKLTEANKRLKEENEKLKVSKPMPSVLESLRPQDNFPNLSEAQAKQVAEQVFDEQGFVDPNLLNQKLAEANRIANEAVTTAKQAQQQLRNLEETQKTKELYIEFPQLNPNGDSFDPEFYGRVRNELIGQMMQGQENPVEAARKVNKMFVQATQTKAEDQEARNLKQQASSNLGTSQGAGAPVDYDYLVEETRKGNPDALAERLKRIGA